MKKIILIISILILGCETNEKGDNAKWQFDPSDGVYIQWSGDNELANEMLHNAFIHLYNVEREKAMTMFEKVLDYDSSLFGPHVVLAGLSIDGSEKQKMHISKAKELVKDNNETSKIFVSLLDLPMKGANWPMITEGAHDKWATMREIEQKGKLIHYYYAFTIPGMENKIKEMEGLLAELKDQTGDENSLPTSGDHAFMIAPVINTLGYFYYNLGDKEKSKALFEQYIELYPNGYNSYDSMGEFYFNEGDMENALKYYNKAIEMYPPAVSANSMISEIGELKKD
ncbi:MAG: hypothetical protein CMC38_00170 [Flavobacteriaceae bacterium]|nr:hypothetical protein [Flavobacteriaceae bacterium]|tara:strand:- start:6697 stop:7548 length:852 start_codon:yes stop_codon:yes gene_type:complete